MITSSQSRIGASPQGALPEHRVAAREQVMRELEDSQKNGQAAQMRELYQGGD
jgi:hypothetical protein